MLLQKTLFQQQFTQMFPVAGHQRILKLGPREKRRIVGDADFDLRRFADRCSGPLRRIAGDDLRQAAAAVQRQIEIIQGFDAGKTVRRIFAEEAHEAAVPDPDADIAERFVHIRSLGHPRKIQQMIVRQFPGSFIQPVIFGPFIENRFRHLRPPLRVNGKLFSHHYGISSSAASGKWSLEASPP